MTQFERRKRARLHLRLPVLLLRTESETPLWTETADINNNGFYCNTREPFAPGDRLTCLIGLPAQPSGSDRLYLEAKVDVVRITVNDGSGFGVGCRISQYHVINDQALPSWAVGETRQKAFEPAIEQPV